MAGLPLKLYNLLPGFYQLFDRERGEPLKKFLEVLQEHLDRIYEDEKVLRVLQDPYKNPEEFLKYIALSLGWEFMAQDAESQRSEAVEIVNFYDLKGTPYAIRLLAAVTFPKWFKYISEYYDGAQTSISTIRRPWALVRPALKELLGGIGVFSVPEWAEQKLHERGRVYDIHNTGRLYHYFVELDVQPGSFEPGELRAAVERFIRQLERFHPAGRTCYLYVRAPSGTTPEHGSAVIAELGGRLTLDLGWTLDTPTITWDMTSEPVHPSLSWHFPKEMGMLDDGRILDDPSWFWDMETQDAHLIVELQ